MRVATALRQRVIDGEFQVGSRIPSLRALSKEYAVSEVTVHTAIRTLQQEDVLESTSGRGTFVKSVPQSTPTSGLEELRAHVNQLSDDMRELANRVKALESHGK
jgi:DNA-binding GntR family transcriptional regulator